MNEKWWSILFGVVMAACAALFVIAPFVGWWLPGGLSTHAAKIDELYYWILGVTGFFFILTEAILVVFMYLYGAGPSRAARKSSPSWNISATKIEMAWTVVPAIILLALAFAQVDIWAEVKYKSRLDKNVWDKEVMPVQVDISARQFEWRIRYPSPSTWREWKKSSNRVTSMANWVANQNFDDVHVPNELHAIMGTHVVVQLSTKDVLHSFNIPQMRVKQDALPGKTIPVWFNPTEYNVERVTDKDGNVRWQYRGGIDAETQRAKNPQEVWEIACAELCGWGHYRMVGKVFVHKDEADFLTWLEWANAHQFDFGATGPK